MEEIRLWSLELDSDKQPSAVPVESVRQLDAERLLEDILTDHPDLLLPGLSLVGRQTPTAGGWLDLLGVDSDGRLVVFELKRGTLARDAVAQVIDYASYLAGLDSAQLSQHVTDRSGTEGIEKFDDFQEWYQQTFVGKTLDSALPPLMVLVGLGVDEATERMTKFLAGLGTGISLLTFHAFQHQGQTLLARHVRIQAPDDGDGPPRTPPKEVRAQALRELALQLGVSERYEEMRRFVIEKLPSAYENPGKAGTSFSLLERTESGNPSYRAYAVIYLDQQSPGRTHLVFYERAVGLAQDQFEQLKQKFPHNATKWREIWFPVNSDEEWKQLKEELDPVLSNVFAAWRNKTQMQVDG